MRKLLIISLAVILTIAIYFISVPTPKAEAVAGNGYYAYVTNMMSDNVSVIDLDNNTVINTISLPAGSNPDIVLANPKNHYIYTGNLGNQTISVIDTQTNNIVTTISGLPVCLAGSYLMSINSVGTKIYLLNQTNVITIIDTVSNTISGTINVVGSSYDGMIAFSPDGSRAYISDPTTANIFEVNALTDTFLTNIPIPSPGLAIAVNENYVYTGSLLGPGSPIYVINRADYSVTPVNMTSAVYGITNGTISPTENVAYFSDHNAYSPPPWPGNQLVLLDTQNNTEIPTPITVGNGALFTQFRPDGARAYTTNTIDNTVSVIDTSARTQLTAIAVGTFPVGIAIADILPPTINSVNLTNNQTVSGTYTISADVSDNYQVAKVEFYIDGELKSSVTGNSSYNYILDTTNYHSTHVVRIDTYDEVGNITSQSYTINVSNQIAPSELPYTGI